jgi:hypothetical protein
MSTPFTPVAGPASESTVAVDLVRRGLYVAPALIAVGAIGWGADGALSVAFAVALVFANFLVAAGIITFSARLGLGVLMAAVLLGYLIRLGLLFVAVWLVKDASWMALVPFGLTLVVTHLGLLFWETRYVSASLAFPALKPKS